MRQITEKSKKSLERLESNYKIIYTVIMSAPLIVALQNMIMHTDAKTGIWDIRPWQELSIETNLLFVVFLLFFIRFFLGDLRYLDLKYLEFKRGASHVEDYSPASRFIDFISLVIHSIFFYMLASAITNFVYFYQILIIILCINSAWLYFVYFKTNSVNRNRLEMASSLRWALNNSICALILIIVYFLNLTYLVGLSVFLFVAAVNTFADFAFSWRMYFPKIKDELMGK